MTPTRRALVALVLIAGLGLPSAARTAEPVEPPTAGSEAAVPRYTLSRIEIRGNDKTLDQVILRYIELVPGEVFPADDPRLERARYRLLAAGLFHDVRLSLARGRQRGEVVLVVTVKERNTIVVRDLEFGLSEITGYGMVDVAERSLLGTGVELSAAFAAADEQYGYRLRLADNHFLDSPFVLRAEGRFNHARDYFGRDRIQVASGTMDTTRSYAILGYDRAGATLGTGYNVLGDGFLTVDYRYERLAADPPVAASNYSFGEIRPIEFGHLLPGHSQVASLGLGLTNDGRDSQVLPSTGSRSRLAIELASEVLGSDYEFSKITIDHATHFAIGRGHSIKVGVFTGLIMGDAPFFDQFFVGDFSAFVPSRLLEMNFSHLHPSVMETTILEMRYEDIAAAIDVEYSLPLWRSDGFFYGLDTFIGAGVFALASREDLRVEPQGYEGYEVVPFDLTANLGLRVDTQIGLFELSLAGLFHFLPGIGRETAE